MTLRRQQVSQPEQQRQTLRSEISIDGKGRYNDHIFMERLWQTLKYEEVNLKAYSDGKEARREAEVGFRFYNAR